MARIIYSPVITEIKGSIGGMTFQKNASGTIARLKPRKPKTNTQKQRDQQPRTKLLQQYWQNLTLAQKIEWNTFAGNHNKIGLNGQEKKLTGYQWFLTINQNRALFGDSFLEEPPVYEIVNPINRIHFEIVENQIYIFFNPFLPNVDVKVSWHVSFVVNSVSKFDFNKCRNIINLTEYGSGGLKLNSINSGGSWSNYYGMNFPPNLGNKNFYLLAYCRFIGINSGISSLAYTTIEKFIWDGSKYVIEEF